MKPLHLLAPAKRERTAFPRRDGAASIYHISPGAVRLGSETRTGVGGAAVFKTTVALCVQAEPAFWERGPTLVIVSAVLMSAIHGLMPGAGGD